MGSKLYLTLLQVFYYHMVIIFTKMYSFITLSKEVLDIVNFTMISLYVQSTITWTCLLKVILIMMMLSFDMQQIRILILILEFIVKEIFILGMDTFILLIMFLFF